MLLNCHSYFSLRYGTLSIDELVEEALNNGVTTLGLTDINNSSGVPDFIKACHKAGIRPITGIEFRADDQLKYVGLARNREGMRELNELLTSSNIRGITLPDRPENVDNCFIIYPFMNRPKIRLRDNEWIGIRMQHIRRLITSDFRSNQSKLLLLHPVTFAGTDGYQLHRNLRAIDHNTLLSKLKGNQTADPSDRFWPTLELRAALHDYPRIIQNTLHVTSQCEAEFDFNSVKNRQTFTGSRSDDFQLLTKLAMDGVEYRYGKKNGEAIQRVRKELDVIARLGFSAYFLITWDIIRYSMSRRFHHVGRGSGANSIVAYCLRITDVDPIKLDLYFERFINPRRTSPPDFDIDYSWKEREEVQDYIFKRYGERHTALLGTISTFRSKSIIRELGKVYGLPKAEIDLLIDEPDNTRNNTGIISQIREIGRKLTDYPNLRSIHAGGVLISEEPITYYTALDMPPKGFPTTQWDMYVAEDIGFEKLDILSQRGIGHIHESIEIIRENRGVSIDIHQVDRFMADKRVRELLKAGETNGCFYIESPAMRGLLKKLQCEEYTTLVAASSIIRPGVARSGMMREYIRRFHNPGGFTYLHPVMEEQLKETFGVMVYQEDVLKVCHHFAGLDLGDADILRRAMSGKYRSKEEFQRIVDKFFQNCRDRGYPEETTREVWRQIESFAAYSFSKAHSASYAVESFQSLYLKAYYPKEFMTAVLNNFGGFFSSWVYINDARRWGATVNLPCVNHSNYLPRIIGNEIFLGFVFVKELHEEIGQEIEKERKSNGEFNDLEQLVSRIQIGIQQLILLIRAGTLRFTGKSKSTLLWEVHMLLGKKDSQELQNPLFIMPRRKFTLPSLERNRLEDAYDEIELFGYPVTSNYFDLLVTQFRGEIKARDLNQHIGKKVRMVGQLVVIKYVRTIKREWMHFAAFLDDTGEFFDTVHFPQSLKLHPFKGYGCYLILGKVVEEFGFPSIEVEKMAKLPVLNVDDKRPLPELQVHQNQVASPWEI
ncbi:MAG: DNA polymerase III subunit alpha [Bacteroidales bacterium]|nr:DNA polymerase III subunit alpha [Bacteroidales bacterium]